MKTQTPFAISVLALIVFSPALIAQTPTLAAVVNPASNVPAGLPASGIAQGSIFVVYGSNLGPATLAQASSLPLPTSAGLSGTSVSITVSGTTVLAPMIYTFATQVAAVLPSTVPVGTGTLSLTYNGQSGTTPITVVASNFGISTLNQTGGGPAVVTRPDYSVITVTNAARPGETLVLWGTGLGKISGSDAAIPVSTDLGTPIQLYLGSQAVNVSYRGRSAAPGLDQINFVVPTNSATGCYVSLVVQTNSTVSNATTIPIATNGGTCSDPGGLSVSDLTPFLNNGTVRLGSVGLSQSTSTTPAIGPLPASTTTSASGFASFYKFTSAQLSQSGSFTGQPSVGGCLVSYITSSAATSVPTFNATGLNAGAGIAVSGPASFTMSPVKNTTGIYVGTAGTLGAGTYSATNGSGGADVGSFTVPLAVSAPLTWTNQTAAATVDRTAPFTVTWTGGDPAGQVVIQGSSLASVSVTLGASFVCTAPASAGKFTIPATVLLSLPASAVISAGTFSIPTGNMSLATNSALQKFQAPGLDYAYASTGSSSGIVMTYK